MASNVAASADPTQTQQHAGHLRHKQMMAEREAARLAGRRKRYKAMPVIKERKAK